MAKYPQRTKLPIAVTEHSNLPLDCKHDTTSNFMDFNVSYFRLMSPDEGIDLTHDCYSRMAPMLAPTNGTVSINHRVFFVPFRTVFPAWNDFIGNVAHLHSDGVYGHVSRCPQFKNSAFVYMFMSTVMSTRWTESTVLDNCDFVVIQGPNTYGYNFTPLGSRVFKLCQSLGYAIDFNLNNVEVYHCALHLLCAAKIYFDWYYPSAYAQDEFAKVVQEMFDYDGSVLFEEKFGQDQLYVLMSYMTKVNYDNDYFTGAWDNPVAPSNGTYSSFTTHDITGTSDYVNSGYESTNGTPLLDAPLVGSNLNRVSISQYALRALKKLSDYMVRHQIVGARVIDRYLSRFGITLSSEKLKRSEFITTYKQFIEFGDVTSTADTEGANLGSYAGKGFSDGSCDISVDTSEYGFAMIITTAVPQVSYFQGADRTTMYQSPFDFFTPEFDNLGVQALATREVFVPMDSRKQYNIDSTNYTQGKDYNSMVFGFVPRYAELKRGVDRITGDFRLRSRSTGIGYFNMYRDVTGFFRNGVENTHHDVNFVLGTDSNQYNRMFYDTTDKVDSMYLFHRFYVKSRFPGKPLFDSYEFDDEDKAKKVDVDVNGVKAN